MRELPPIEARTPRHANGDAVTPAATKQYAYYWVTRAKRSHPWQAVAVCYVAGDACLAVAQGHFEAHGLASPDYALAKLVDQSTWQQFQLTQHLKAVRKA